MVSAKNGHTWQNGHQLN
ncbi:hypothetical protein A2U01_0055717, partial [Trifolium medium]|nr:hypothetical protein [Trifolium medium]